VEKTIEGDEEHDKKERNNKTVFNRSFFET